MSSRTKHGWWWLADNSACVLNLDDAELVLETTHERRTPPYRVLVSETDDNENVVARHRIRTVHGKIEDARNVALRAYLRIRERKRRDA